MPTTDVFKQACKYVRKNYKHRLATDVDATYLYRQFSNAGLYELNEPEQAAILDNMRLILRSRLYESEEILSKEAIKSIITAAVMKHRSSPLSEELEKKEQRLKRKEQLLKQTEQTLKQKEQTLKQKEQTLKQTEQTLKQAEQTLKQKEQTLKQKEQTLKQKDQRLELTEQIIEQKIQALERLKLEISTTLRAAKMAQEKGVVGDNDKEKAASDNYPKNTTAYIMSLLDAYSLPKYKTETDDGSFTKKRVIPFDEETTEASLAIKKTKSSEVSGLVVYAEKVDHSSLAELSSSDDDEKQKPMGTPHLPRSNQ